MDIIINGYISIPETVYIFKHFRQELSDYFNESFIRRLQILEDDTEPFFEYISNIQPESVSVFDINNTPGFSYNYPHNEYFSHDKLSHNDFSNDRSLNKSFYMDNEFQIFSMADGGLERSLWDMAHTLRSGFRVSLHRLPILQETIEICEYFGIDPYDLHSLCTFISVDGGHGLNFFSQIFTKNAKNIDISTVFDIYSLYMRIIPDKYLGWFKIGELTPHCRDMILENRSRHSCLGRPEKDSIYKILPDFKGFLQPT